MAKYIARILRPNRSGIHRLGHGEGFGIELCSWTDGVRVRVAEDGGFDIYRLRLNQGVETEVTLALCVRPNHQDEFFGPGE